MKGRFKSWIIAIKLSRMCRYMEKHGIKIQNFNVSYDGTVKNFYARSIANRKIGFYMEENK